MKKIVPFFIIVLIAAISVAFAYPFRAKILGAFGVSLETHEHEEEHTAGLPEDLVEVSLSPQALKNIGLGDDDSLLKIEARSFAKSLRFPAIVAALPGRTQSKVPSPVYGIVTKIYYEPGSSVSPGDALFEITLTRQDAIDAQMEFLRLQKECEILNKEIERIRDLPEGLAAKELRELQFEKDKNLLSIDIQKNILLVQGLDAEMIARLEEGEITRSVTTRVPPVSHHGLISDENPGETKDALILDSLNVNVGQVVALGDPLCVLCDLCTLSIRGEAFSYDEELLMSALREKTPVRVVFEGKDKKVLENLTLRSIDNHIDETNRTTVCYADFANTIDLEQTLEQGDYPAPRTFTHWRFKPGQRGEMEVEYEILENVIILPAEAVAREVNDAYVFEWVGNDPHGQKIWRRKPVHIVYRVKDICVLANDGSIFPGSRVATRGAEFLLAALNALNSGGSVESADPHAGCSH
ncbi:MAG: efflux RND transporter periplasmic adaptor subunit [Planctomycetia bacterium]|nr:efflux RND transporter periplasmic adaptor subunit [Planctomycetia bacterium]